MDNARMTSDGSYFAQYSISRRLMPSEIFPVERVKRTVSQYASITLRCAGVYRLMSCSTGWPSFRFPLIVQFP